MTFLLISLTFILLYKSKICVFDFNKSYIDRDTTNIIKGYFIILVFLSHFISYRRDMLCSDTYFVFQKFMGQLIVSMFLFYSGFGVAEQIKSKGNDYINSMPVNRILKTIFNFDLAVLLFYFLSLIKGDNFGLKKIMLSFIGWDSLGNSNWYIFTIIILYIITFVSYYLINVIMKVKSKEVFVITTVLISLCYIFIMMKHKQTWWYDTALTYVAGIIYSYYRNKIELFITKNNINYGIVSAICLILFVFTKKYSSVYYPIFEITSILFALLIVLITLKIRFNSKILYYCGKNLFGLYILQRLPMIFFKDIYSINNVYIYFILCVGVTVVLNILYTKVSEYLWNTMRNNN